MIKRLSELGLIVGLAGAMIPAVASAGPIEMFLTSGGQSTVLLIGNTGIPSSVSFSGTLNGWTIASGTGGASFSPHLTESMGLDLGGFLVTCASGGGCSKDSLTMVISATGFTTPIDVNQFALDFRGSALGGTATSSAYYDTSNGYFCNAANSAASFKDYCGENNLIGSLTMHNTSSDLATYGGPDTIRSYSLTLSDTFSAGGGLDPSYSVNSVVTTVAPAVPEPGTLALFGSGLLCCASFRRRLRSARQS